MRPLGSRHITVSDFLVRWQENYVAGNVTPKTAERYKQLIKNQIAPHVGQVQLQKLRPHHLAHLYSTLGKAGLAARTIGHVHRLLHRALGHAGTWGIAQQNVASLVQPPKVQADEVAILTEDQCRKLLTRVEGRTLYPILTLALATGARRGELLALRLKDFNPERGTMRIERSLEQTKAGSASSRPRASMASAPSLSRLTWSQHCGRIWSKCKSADRSWAWAGQAVRTISFHVGIDRCALLIGSHKVPARHDCAEDEGLTLHSIRHTHVSELIASGMDVLTVSRRLGHGSPAITLTVYSHLIEGKDNEAAAVMERAFNKLRTE